MPRYQVKMIQTFAVNVEARKKEVAKEIAIKQILSDPDAHNVDKYVKVERLRDE